MKKKLGYGILVISVLFLTFNYSAIRYGIGQGIGQAQVLFNAVPLETIKADPSTADSTLQKIAFIEEVRQFAIDSIGLYDSENYTTFFDQKGNPILWVVTASPEFKIEGHQWCFPIAGCFPYKGFFDLKKAQIEEQKMKDLGLDTEIGEVSAWSTLGVFKDPILSSMLERSEASLANLIIHELTHATLYVKNDVEFNENLASFIGKEGAIYFLNSKYGAGSKIVQDYQNTFKKRRLFGNYIREEIQKLNQFYSNLSESTSLKEKRRLKSEEIEKIKNGLWEIGYYADTIQARKKLQKFNPNNAYFSGFSTYSKQQNNLSEIFEKKYNNHLKDFIRGMKNAHGVD